MPAEKLVPYTLEMYEHRNTDNRYNLTDLTSHDSGFDEAKVMDIIENFFEDTAGENLEPPSSEKTLVVEEFARDGQIIEAIISSGYHGYQAELRDVETGHITHIKGEDEAEQLPLYFLAYRPDTTAGEPYDNGETLFIVLQQVNRIGIKTKLKNHFERRFLQGVSQKTTVNMNPVGTEEVLQKVLDANRITKIDMRIRKIPGDDERRFQLVEGLTTEEVGTRSLVLRPEHGGTFSALTDLVARAKNSDTHFEEFIDEDVENFTVTVQNDQGRNETFSLLSEEIAMRKDLDGESLQKEAGLIASPALRRETNNLVNDIVNTDIVEPLRGDTNVDR